MIFNIGANNFVSFIDMEEVALKKYLIRIADKLTLESTLEDVFEHLALLSDIDESELQEKKGEILTLPHLKKSQEVKRCLVLLETLFNNRRVS